MTPRPPVGARVRVTWPGSTGYDPDGVTGHVVFHYPDGAFDVQSEAVADKPHGLTTLFPSELADGRATLEIL